MLKGYDRETFEWYFSAVQSFNGNFLKIESFNGTELISPFFFERGDWFLSVVALLPTPLLTGEEALQVWLSERNTSWYAIFFLIHTPIYPRPNVMLVIQAKAFHMYAKPVTKPRPVHVVVLSDAALFTWRQTQCRAR
jgi:hypothetical protein